MPAPNATAQALAVLNAQPAPVHPLVMIQELHRLRERGIADAADVDTVLSALMQIDPKGLIRTRWGLSEGRIKALSPVGMSPQSVPLALAVSSSIVHHDPAFPVVEVRIIKAPIAAAGVLAGDDALLCAGAGGSVTLFAELGATLDGEGASNAADALSAWLMGAPGCDPEVGADIDRRPALAALFAKVHNTHDPLAFILPGGGPALDYSPAPLASPADRRAALVGSLVNEITATVIAALSQIGMNACYADVDAYGAITLRVVQHVTEERRIIMGRVRAALAGVVGEHAARTMGLGLIEPEPGDLGPLAADTRGAFKVIAAEIEDAPNDALAWAASQEGATLAALARTCSKEVRHRVTVAVARAKRLCVPPTVIEEQGADGFVLARKDAPSIAALIQHVITAGSARVVFDPSTGAFYRSTGGAYDELRAGGSAMPPQFNLIGWSASSARAVDGDDRALSEGTIKAALSLLRDRLTPPDSRSPFDRAPGASRVVGIGGYLLPETGAPRRITSADMVLASSMVSGSIGPLSAPCDRWLDLLRSTWAGCPDVADRVAFLQEWLGCALWGYGTRAGVMLVLTGTGANGKSTVITALNALFPDRVNLEPADICGEGNTAEYAIMRLQRARLAVTTEMSSLRITRASRFKAAVVGEELTGRHPYGRYETFKASASWLAAVNELPSVADTSNGFWRRIRVMDFPNTFSPGGEGYRDADTIAADIQHDLWGILLWAREGLRRWRDAGSFTVYASGSAALDSWRQGSSSPECWLSEVTGDPEALTHAVPLTLLYDSYRDFCTAGGYDRPVTKYKLGQILRSRGYTVKASRHTYPGVEVATCVEINAARPKQP